MKICNLVTFKIVLGGIRGLNLTSTQKRQLLMKLEVPLRKLADKLATPDIDIGESGNEWANFWFLIFIIFSNTCFGSELIPQLLYLFGYIKKS